MEQVTPTRELAMQIFKVLTKIGAKHDFSAGLLIGGKQILDEKESIGRMSIPTMFNITCNLILHQRYFNCNTWKIVAAYG